MKIFDFGCGKNKIENAIGVDITLNSECDLIFNLDKVPYPIKSNTIDLIYMRHSLEHLENIFEIFSEIARILKKGGRLIIISPHYTCAHSYIDITHKRAFSIFSFEPFYRTGGYIQNSGPEFKLILSKLRFRTIYRLFGIELVANLFPRTYEKYFAYIFPAKEVKFILEKI